MRVETVSLLLALLTMGANLLIMVMLGMAVASRFSERSAGALGSLREMVGGSSLILAWIVALVATLGSASVTTRRWYGRTRSSPWAFPSGKPHAIPSDCSSSWRAGVLTLSGAPTSATRRVR